MDKHGQAVGQLQKIDLLTRGARAIEILQGYFPFLGFCQECRYWGNTCLGWMRFCDHPQHPTTPNGKACTPPDGSCPRWERKENKAERVAREYNQAIAEGSCVTLAEWLAQAYKEDNDK